MTATTTTSSLSNNSQLDLRAPLLTRLRRGTGGRWLRNIILILLDASGLYMAWRIAEFYETAIDSF